MSVAASRSDRNQESAAALAPVRVVGGVRTSFVMREGSTSLGVVEETGGYRIRFPKSSGLLEAVLLNTGGGLAGGDAARFNFSAEHEAEAVVTTQAAERVYRSLGPDSVVAVELTLGKHARLAWLPQETIIFSGARLRRRLEVSVEETSRLLMVESLVFGRAAMGEDVERGAIVDDWRVRRNGKLVFAESVRLEGAVRELLSRAAVGSACRGMATILYVGPDAEDRIAAARQATAEIANGALAAASAWNGLLCARIVGETASAMRAATITIVEALSGRPVPRSWSI